LERQISNTLKKQHRRLWEKISAGGEKNPIYEGKDSSRRGGERKERWATRNKCVAQTSTKSFQAQGGSKKGEGGLARKEKPEEKGSLQKGKTQARGGRLSEEDHIVTKEIRRDKSTEEGRKGNSWRTVDRRKKPEKAKEGRATVRRSRNNVRGIRK